MASADEGEAEGLQVPPFPDDLRPVLAERSPLITHPVDGSILPGSGWSVSEVPGRMARHPAFDRSLRRCARALRRLAWYWQERRAQETSE